MVDGAAIPQRLEQRVGEAQHHEVLHRLLAEVVVDAEDRRLGEHRADLVVDRPRRREIAPDRLLEHHPGAPPAQAAGGKLAADRAEQVRRDREVEHPDAPLLGQLGRQGVEAARAERVDRDVAQPVEEAGEAGLVEIGGVDVLAQRRIDLRDVGLAPGLLRAQPMIRLSGGSWPSRSR